MVVCMFVFLCGIFPCFILSVCITACYMFIKDQSINKSGLQDFDN